MLTFLFWNIGKKNLSRSIERLVASARVDVLVLAESHLRPEQLLPTLARQGRGAFHETTSPYRRVSVYTRGPADFVKVMSSNHPYYLICELTFPTRPPMLVAAAHLLSKASAGAVAQQRLAHQFARDITEAERVAQHDRTLVIGDLNFNPFEPAAFGKGCLHAVSCRAVAEMPPKKAREVARPAFYNPMWGLLGDDTPGPPGTFFYSDGGDDAPYWNSLDQVLLRPSLVPHFDKLRLAVLESDTFEPLVDDGRRPDRDKASDHLPLLISLDV